MTMDSNGQPFNHRERIKMLKKTAVFTLAAMASIPAMSADDGSVMVVTASGHEQKLKDAAASISIVSQEDLSQRNYADLAEALSDVEGVDVGSTTGKQAVWTSAFAVCPAAIL